jgi:hypothetical protein
MCRGGAVRPHRNLVRAGHLSLYDLTNSHCEGTAAANPSAARGRSKQKRSDCPLVTLGLVLDGSGFVRRSKMFAGKPRHRPALRDHQVASLICVSPERNEHRFYRLEVWPDLPRKAEAEWGWSVRGGGVWASESPESVSPAHGSRKSWLCAARPGAYRNHAAIKRKRDPTDLGYANFRHGPETAPSPAPLARGLRPGDASGDVQNSRHSYRTRSTESARLFRCRNLMHRKNVIDHSLTKGVLYPGHGIPA